MSVDTPTTPSDAPDPQDAIDTATEAELEAHFPPDGDGEHTATIWNKIGFWFPHIVAVAYAGVIGAAFRIQILEGDMPCPLCMLQRMAMVLVGIGAIWMIGLVWKKRLNLNMYIRCLGLMLLAALLGAFISFRQVELHILPGDPGYGDPVLGLHLYTWALITFIVVIAFAAVMLLFGRTFLPAVPGGDAAKWASRILVGIFLFIIAANIVSVFMEEGLSLYLDDDPVRYELPYDLGFKEDQ